MSGAELFDVCDARGEPTGETITRDEAHRTGTRHRVVHVWIPRVRAGRREVLLEQRSPEKDAFPNRFDTCAGHIDAGDAPLDTARRELFEELGVRAAAEELRFIGKFEIRYERPFHGAMFRDWEISFSYVLEREVALTELTLQVEEVSDARWFDLGELKHAVAAGDDRFCISPEGLKLLTDFLESK